MAKMVIAIVAALIAACAVPQNKALPQVPSVLTQVQGPQAVPTVSTPQPTSYLVRLNFLLYTDEITASPVTSCAFEEALTEWTSHLPIECGIYREDSAPSAAFASFFPTVSNMPGIVRVRIVDIHESPWSMPQGVLGFWDHTQNNLVLDKATLETDADMAYTICLHELGHVLGLAHMKNQGHSGLSGDIMIPDEFDASRLVMYPVYDPDKNKRARLSNLELEIAYQSLLGLQRLHQNSCLGLTSN